MQLDRINPIRLSFHLTIGQYSEGTSVVDLSDPAGPNPRYALLMKSDHTSLYLTRDLAAALDRHRTHAFDRMYYVVDKSQADHFRQLQGVLGRMELDWADR